MVLCCATLPPIPFSNSLYITFAVCAEDIRRWGGPRGLPSEMGQALAQLPAASCLAKEAAERACWTAQTSLQQREEAFRTAWDVPVAAIFAISEIRVYDKL